MTGNLRRTLTVYVSAMQTTLRQILALAFFVSVLAPAAQAAAQSETEEVNRTIPFQPGGTLKLKNFSGDVRIVGSNTTDVVIHAIRRAPRERLDRIRLTIESSGSTVTINANDRVEDDESRENNVVETEFEIRVPRQTDLEVNVFSSPVTVEEVGGRHKVHGFSGNLRLLKIAGSVDAKTFSGSIRLEAAEWGAGQDLDLNTFSGDVEVILPDQAGADVRFNSFSGDISSDVPLMLQSQSRRSLRATLNNGGGDVRVQTFSGHVRLGR